MGLHTASVLSDIKEGVHKAVAKQNNANLSHECENKGKNKERRGKNV